MLNLSEEASRTKIAKVMKALRERELPIVRDTLSSDEVIAAMIQFAHSRVLYVINAQSNLIGTISLGRLVRHVFARSYDPQIHPKALIGVITAEAAKDIMEHKPISATEDEEVGTVLKRMIESNVKELPIVDKENKVVGDLTMIDLLEFLSVPTKD